MATSSEVTKRAKACQAGVAQDRRNTTNTSLLPLLPSCSPQAPAVPAVRSEKRRAHLRTQASLP
eukprot:220850-Chlamydomonas_euryale.AAC.1